MKRVTLAATTVTLLLLLGLFAPPGARAQTGDTTPDPAEEARPSEPVPETIRIYQDRISIFDNREIRVPANVIQSGDIVSVFGGKVSIEGEVTRDVVVVGGEILISGTVRGSVVAVLSDVELAPGARVGHDMINVGGHLDDAGADIHGMYNNVSIPHIGPIRGEPIRFLVAAVAWFRTLSIVLFFVVLVLFAALSPRRLRAMSDEAPRRYLGAFLAGLLIYLAWWLLAPVLLATLVAFPIALLLLHIVKWLGRAALLHFVGRRFGLAMGRELSLLGALFLGFVPFAALLLVPLYIDGFWGLGASLAFTALFWLIVDVPAIGLVVLTRLGGRGSGPPSGPPAPAWDPSPPAPPHAEERHGPPDD